ncbi:MAG: hypothetical protein LUF90_08930 [Rikenellaceae bacterium]|nr:hypothetical protein [Rikenellaceae bacterium]
MKTFQLLIMLLLGSHMTMHACSTDGAGTNAETSDQPVGIEDPSENGNGIKLVIKINSAEFVATLEDNAAAKAFKEMLPMSIGMSELNGNEKYYTMQQSLPTAAASPGTIHSGDIMLYGSAMLVLFYKTFATSYSYTRIGRVDDPSGLERALGNGIVTITFVTNDN